MPEIKTLPIAALYENALRRVLTDNNDGILLNRDGKLLPTRAVDESSTYMPHISPFNALAAAIQGDIKGYETNNVVFFNEWGNSGLQVREGAKGIPFIWQDWKEYQRRDITSDERITRDAYLKLPQNEKRKWKAVPNPKKIYIFNIAETTIADNKEAYAALVKQSGGTTARISDPKAEDVRRRKEMNGFLRKIGDNLCPVRKGGDEAKSYSWYDPKKDIIHLMPQSSYATKENDPTAWERWAQDANRLIATATGVRKRLGREGCDNGLTRVLTPKQEAYEALVVELSSAYRQLSMGLPARVKPENMHYVHDWLNMFKDNASTERLMNNLQRDLNMACSMVAEAERKHIETNMERAAQQVKQTASQRQDVPEHFSHVSMLKNDQGKWCLYMRPDGADKGYAVCPSYADTSLYFTTKREKTDDVKSRVFQELAKKYWGQDPERVPRHDIFYENTDLRSIPHALSIPQVNYENGEYTLVTSIDGMRQHPVSLPKEQAMRLLTRGVCPDTKAYKLALAVRLYSKELRQMGQGIFTEQELQQRQEEHRGVDEKHDGKYVLDGADLTKGEYQQREKARHEQEAKEAKEREAFRKEVVNPALRTYLGMKAVASQPNIVVLVHDGDNYRSFYGGAERIAQALGMQLEDKPTREVNIAESEYTGTVQKLSQNGLAVVSVEMPRTAAQAKDAEATEQTVSQTEQQDESRAAGRGR